MRQSLEHTERDALLDPATAEGKNAIAQRARNIDHARQFFGKLALQEAANAPYAFEDGEDEGQ